MTCIFINVGGYFINTRHPCSVYAQHALSEPKLKTIIYNNVENSITYHFQLKSLKYTQYLGLGGHFCDLGKTGLKTQKLSFFQFNSGQMKHNLKKTERCFCKKYIHIQPYGVSFNL